MSTQPITNLHDSYYAGQSIATSTGLAKRPATVLTVAAFSLLVIVTTAVIRDSYVDQGNKPHFAVSHVPGRVTH